MELRLDGRFIDTRPVGEMTELPKSLLDAQTNRLMTLDELMGQVPLDKFLFEGVTVMRVNDVTEQAVITEIKNMLLDNNAFLNASVYKQLEKHVQSLIGLKDLTVGI